MVIVIGGRVSNRSCKQCLPDFEKEKFFFFPYPFPSFSFFLFGGRKGSVKGNEG